ncbi:MAG TPA: Do family serine endopeptidase [Burkholderiaceae bacterium]|nr:Do family serine endopeptidase [Burkholderiaceae bacterium]
MAAASLVLMLMAAAPAAQASRSSMDYVGLVERHGPSVVHVSVRGRPSPTTQTANATPPTEGPPARSFGSGFVVSDDGFILTNAHVVANAIDVYVHLTDKRELRAKVIGLDNHTDVAVLKIDTSGLPVVKIGSIDRVKVGEPVAAIGSPFGFEHTITSGIVSAKSRNVDDLLVPFIQTDAAINPGNSGGPLFNAAGEVIGINSRIWSRSGGFQGLSFAIPIDIAMQVASDLRAGRRVTRGAIGVTVQPVSSELARAFGLDRARGALVLDVEKGGPAQRAGLRAGDVVLTADSRTIDTSLDLPRVIGSLRPGTQTVLEVLRDDQTVPLTVGIVELRQEDRASSPVSTAPATGAPEATLGLVLRPLTPEEQRRNGVQEALMVESVTAKSAALRAEVKSGDLILGVRGQPYRSIDEFREQLKAASSGPFALLLLRNNQRKFVAIEPN